MFKSGPLTVGEHSVRMLKTHTAKKQPRACENVRPQIQIF